MSCEKRTTLRDFVANQYERKNCSNCIQTQKTCMLTTGDRVFDDEYEFDQGDDILVRPHS